MKSSKNLDWIPKNNNAYQGILLSSGLPNASRPSLIIILLLLLPEALNVKVASLDSGA